jgi:hypothetical protein
MKWISDIEENLSISIGNVHYPKILVDIFEGVIQPNISLDDDSQKVIIPIGFTIKISGSAKIYTILSNRELFHSFPIALQRGFFDILYFLLKRSSYDVIRFQCYAGDGSNKGNENEITRILLNLLDDKSSSLLFSIPICKRIIRLLGSICAAGISVLDMKDFLGLLKTPTELTNSTLHSLKMMMKEDNAIVKASPHCFFNFGGFGSGLFSESVPFPFQKEYHIFTWFRIENFDNSDNDNVNLDGPWKQHLISIMNSQQYGLDVYIENKLIKIAVIDARGPPQIISIETHPLRRGVFYHISIKHCKPRLSIFSKDEMTVYIDHQQVFQDDIRFPNSTLLGQCEFSCGNNFNGQLGPIYFASEALSSLTVESIARLDVGKLVDGVPIGANTDCVDLISSITTSDRKVTNITSKLSTVYHPNRCSYGHALDIHSGRHASIGPLSHSWHTVSAKAALISLGGIACLLPMFPRLLIDSDEVRNANMLSSSASIDIEDDVDGFHEDDSASISSKTSGFSIQTSLGFGRSLPDMNCDPTCDLIFDYNTLHRNDSDSIEVNDDGCIGLLIGILAACIGNNKLYQRDLIRMKGIEMIEYALTCISNELFQGEGDGCVLSLVQLQSIVGDNIALKNCITKRLLFNFNIWSNGNFPFQIGLMSVLLAAIRAQPLHFITLIGTDGILDYISSQYLEKEEEKKIEKTKDNNIIKEPTQNNFNEVENDINSESKLDKEKESISFDEITTPGKINSENINPLTPVDIAPTERRFPRTVSRSQSIGINFKSVLSRGISVINENSPSVITSGSFFKDKIDDFNDNNINFKDSELDKDDNKTDSSKHRFKFPSNDDDDDGNNIPNSFEEDIEKEKENFQINSNLNNESNSGENLDDINEPTFTITREERKYLRGSLQSMIMIMAQTGLSEREIRPLLHFIEFCPDLVTVNEIAQLLLCLLVENGNKMTIVLTEICHGPEEFASFIIHRLINQPVEEIRCTGIRLLTHFYLRIDTLPVSLVMMTMRSKKSTIVSRTMNKISMLSGIGQGMQRLEICGGLAYLCEIIGTYKDESTVQTYSALLEMLLTKPGSKNQATVQYSSANANMSPTGESMINLLPTSQHQMMSPTSFFTASSILEASISPKGLGISQLSANSSLSSNLQFGQRAVFTSAQSLSPMGMSDEHEDIMNTVVLPTYFYLLPKLPLSLQSQVLTDLLALLKHSSHSRDSFVANPSWHICLYSLVSQFIRSEGVTCGNLSTDTLIVELYKYSSNSNLESSINTSDISINDNGSNLKIRDGFQKSFDLEDNNLSGSLKILNGSLLRTWNSNVAKKEKHKNIPSSKKKESSDDEQEFDTLFAIGMKVYATLLLHALDFKSGWREIEKAISQSYFIHNEDEKSVSVSQAVLSHVVNEMSFSMKSRFDKIKKMKASKDSYENTFAMDKLDNILSLLLTVFEFSLDDKFTSGFGILHLNIGKLRVRCYNEIFEELEVKKAFDEAIFIANSPKFAETTSLTLEGNDIASPNLNVNTSQIFAEQIENTPSSPTKPLDESNCELSKVAVDLAEERLRLILNRKRNESEKSSESNSVGSNNENDENSDKINTDLEPIINWNHSWSSPSHLSPPIDGKQSKKFVSAENLRPLERGHNVEEGRLILILQCIRLFDEIFWPNENGPFRDKYMLVWVKDRMAKDSFPTSPIVEESSNKNVNSNVNNEPNSGNPESKKSSKECLTLFSSTMKICLYVHINLSPLIDMSNINVLRMRLLLKSSFKIRQLRQSTPVDDWLVACLLQVTTSLQRISVSLTNVYDLLGIVHELCIPVTSATNISDEYTNSHDKDLPLFEKLLENDSLLNQIHKIFDSILGKNLIKFVRLSINLLIDACIDHELILLKALGKKSLTSLKNFSNRCKNKFPDVIDKTYDDIEQKTPNSSEKFEGRGRTLSTSFFNRNENKVDEDDNDDFYSRTSDLNIDDRPEIFTPKNMDHLNEPKAFGKHVVELLQLLRDPFFSIDLLNSIRVVMSITSLESHEQVCSKAFSNNIMGIRNSLEKYRHPWKRVHEELRELRSLNASVSSMIATHEKARKTSKKSIELIDLKIVSSSWHNCLQIFETDWSPWYNQELDTNDAQKGASYLLSDHRDSRMRSFLLKKSSESIDHSDAAYLEGKQRDQQAFELGVELESSSSESSSAVSSSLFLKTDLLRSKITNINQNSGSTIDTHWGDEDEDDEDEDDLESVSTSKTTTAELIGSITANGLIGGLGQFAGTDKRPHWTYAYHWGKEEKVVHLIDGTYIQLEFVVAGVILITNKFIYFHPRKQVGGLLPDATQALTERRWHLDRLIEVYGRRYLLQNCGIELFFADAPEVLLAFNTPSDLQKFNRILRRQNTPLMLSISRSLNPQHVFANSPWTDQWRRRLISNFEYLMRLNIVSGRSYNDITQYPVFPWVIADYESSTLDLQNPETFRDLSKPVGALNPTRLKEIMDRYSSFDADTVPPFMYGSHYSSAGVVIHYMIRQEPFTTLAINLQGGRFDCPDRLFFDVNSTWNGVNQSMSDVKELIPEMFCCPEILLNSNKLPLGELQEDEQVVNDVVLPPWASDAYEFVRLNREALESDYVSENLHKWIDLIFGYKQRGKEAENANNLFYYLTYENCPIDIDNMEDEIQKEATKAQVTHFGQTPSQLFSGDPHLPRLPLYECLIPLCSDINNLSRLTIYTPPKQLIGHGAAISVRCSSDKLIVFYADFTVGYYKWKSFPDGEGSPFQVSPDKEKVLTSVPFCKSEDILKRKSFVPKFKPLLSRRASMNSNFDQLSFPELLSTRSAHSSSIDFGNLSSSYSQSTPPNLFSSNKSSSNKTSIFNSVKNRMTGLINNRRNTIGSVIEVDTKLSNSNDENYNTTLSYSKNANANELTNNETISEGEDNSIFSQIHGSVNSLPTMSSNNIALSVADMGYSRIITCGYWDNSLKVHSLDTLKEVASNSNAHTGAVTCLQLGYQGGHTLLTGGDDATCRVWIMESPSLATAFSKDFVGEDDENEHLSDSSLTCVHVLYGHHRPITCISYSHDLDIVFSSSKNGYLCLHTVRKGEYIRSINDMVGSSVDVLLAISPGYLVAHSWESLIMNLYWINGNKLASITVSNRIETFSLNGSGDVLVCGMQDGIISLHTIWNLEVSHVIDLSRHLGIRSLWFTEGNYIKLLFIY